MSVDWPANLHDAIRLRVSRDAFDANEVVERTLIERLICSATRAPSAFNLQNWRFVAVRSCAMKRRLHDLAYGQRKVAEASAVVIVVGTEPDAGTLRHRFADEIAAGRLSEERLARWEAQVRRTYTDELKALNEAVRSASLAAATLMLAATGEGLASCPMIGFDPDGVREVFDLADHEHPIMLVALGKPTSARQEQKTRRPVSDVLSFA